jgi:hypothetical protein
MHSKSFNRIISITLTVLVAGLIVYDAFLPGFSFISATQRTIQIFALGILIFKSKLRSKVKYFVSVLLSTALILIGILFKLMHWYSANSIMVTGLITTCLVYTIYFYTKLIKSHVDLLKLVWVILHCSGMLLVLIFH